MADDVSTAELVRTINRLEAEMSRSFTRLEAMLETRSNDHESRIRAIERIDIAKALNDAEQKQKDHEDRLRRAEKWMYGLSGTGAGTGVIALLIELLKN